MGRPGETDFRLGLVLFVLSWAGCAVPQIWYTPHGNGVVKKVPNTVNLRNRLEINLGSRVSLDIWAEPHGRDTDIRLQLFVPATSWVQFTSDTVQVYSHEANVKRATVIHQKIESNEVAAQGVDYRAYRSLDRLDGGGKQGRNFWINIRITDFRPSQFAVKMPKLIVNGNVVDIAPVEFRLHRGVILYYEP
jgi:hypothetical protein